jgi:uncharacterized protein (TIRG00374 family)
MEEFQVKQPRQKRTVGFYLRILISIALLALILSRVDWRIFRDVLASINYVYLLFPIIGYYVNIWLSVYKWDAILDYIGIREKFSSLFYTYLIGAYVNNFLPSTIGGDGYRFVRIRSDHPSKGKESFSSILLERGFGYFVLIMVNFILFAVYWETVIQIPLLFTIEVMLIFAVLILGGLWTMRGRFGFLYNKWTVLRKLDEYLKFLEIRDPKTILKSLLSSFLFVIISGFSLAVFYWATGTQVDWLYAIYVSTFLNIVGAIPITLNGLGLVELVQIGLMSLQGIPNETVVAVSIIARVLTILLSVPGGLLYLGKSFSKTEKSGNSS